MYVKSLSQMFYWILIARLVYSTPSLFIGQNPSRISSFQFHAFQSNYIYRKLQIQLTLNLHQAELVKRNAATAKNVDSKVTMEHYDTIINFPLFIEFATLWKLDHSGIQCNTPQFYSLCFYLLSYSPAGLPFYTILREKR